MTEKEQLLTAELQKAQGRMARLETAFKKTIESQAAAAIQAAGGDPGLLGPVVMGRVRFFEDGENFIIGVADKHGGKRIRDSKGTPFTIADLVDEMKADPEIGKAFGQTTDKETPTNTMRRVAFDQLTPADKMQFVRRGGRVTD